MAPFLPDNLIDEVRDRSDIVEVVSQYVSLRQKGNRYWGLCPFHQEKTPSFSVNAAEQFYYCFGCHAGGNVFQFIQSVEHCDFTESVRILAERARVALPEQAGGSSFNGQKDRRDKLYRAGREAARYYHEKLMSPQGEKALAYLMGRGLTQGTIRRFGLGYAPDSWDGLLGYLRGQGIEDSVMAEFGLIRQKDSRSYDAFRHRVMFPIIDSRSRVIGFGGRVLDDSLPKYINSPETPVFNKRKNLYGIHVLKKLGTLDRIVIVEGYMDLISMHQAGFQAVVASLGTALTQEQARLLRRYCPDVVIAYDADAAGENATLRGMKILEEAGLRVRVATLTDGKDPDDYARRHGLPGIEDLLDKALPLNQYHVSRIREAYDLTRPEERTRYVSECCREVLTGIESPVERSEFVKKLHMETGVSETAIEEEIALGRMKAQNQRKNRTGNSRDNNADDPGQKADIKGDSGVNRALVHAERVIMRFALSGGDAARQVFDTLQWDDFSDPVMRKAAQVLHGEMESGRQGTIAGIMDRFDPSESSALTEAMDQANGDYQDGKFIEHCLDQLLLSRIKANMDIVADKIKQEKAEDKKKLLKKEFDELKVNYHKIKQGNHRKEGHHD